MKTSKNKYTRACTKRILVVGGGISGLETVRQLQTLSKKCKTQFHITLLEKNAECGGRIKTIRTSNTTFYEAGASRIGYSQQRVAQLIRILNLYKLECVTGESNPTWINPKKELCDSFKKIKNAFIKRYNEQRLKQLSWYDILKEECKTESEVEAFVRNWGFTSVIQNLNAYDFWKGIHNYTDSNYYTLQGGLQSLPDALLLNIKANTNTTIYTNATLHYIQINKQKHYAEWIIRKHNHNKKYSDSFDAIILALPADALQSVNGLPNEIASRLSYVSLNPILHCYVKTVEQTPSNIIKWDSVTDTVLHRARPSHDPNWFQVSYTDNNAALYMYKMLNTSYGNHFLKEKTKFFVPSWNKIDYYFWKAGTHSWKPNHISDANYSDMLQFNPKIPFFIVGSCFSHSQAWIEGALETVNDAMILLQEMWFKTYKQNSNDGTVNER